MSKRNAISHLHKALFVSRRSHEALRETHLLFSWLNYSFDQLFIIYINAIYFFTDSRCCVSYFNCSFCLYCFERSSETNIAFFLLGIITLYFRSSFKEWAISRYYNSILIRNEDIFEKVNAILSSKKGDVPYPPIPGHEDSIFSVSEIQTLNQFLKETRVIYIRKDDKKIFYPIWSVPLEMDYGIFYFHSGYIPIRHFKHIKGKWYYD